MDRRIIKTKRSLKEALIELMNEKSFEKITVTEICDRAYTSRITFYTYYTDKYNLLHEIFMDQESKAEEKFAALQEQNNPQRDPAIGINNLVTILTGINIPGIKSSSYLLRNTDLLFFYFKFLTENLEKLETEFADQMTTDYTLRNLNTFLILGLWGFIHADDQEDISEKTMNEVCALIQDLMTSNIFRKRKPEDPYQTAGRLEESESNPGPEASQSKRTADTSLPVRNEDASVQVRSENSSQRVLESDPKAAVSEAVSSEETSPAASVSDAAVSRTVPSQAAVLKAAASAASGRGSD